MKPKKVSLLGKKILMKSNLELLSEMNCFMNVLFIFTVLKLRLFLDILFHQKDFLNFKISYTQYNKKELI
ncbi:hypothetical protein FDF31_13985 [Clostridium sporogenes]|nr:hypothetical protein [Clostridium sporogenes]NFS26692.1 hypothetical protein [Clostridium sporogenes]